MIDIQELKFRIQSDTELKVIQKYGKMIRVSGPEGCGKSLFVGELIKELRDVREVLVLSQTINHFTDLENVEILVCDHNFKLTYGNHTLRRVVNNHRREFDKLRSLLSEPTLIKNQKGKESIRIPNKIQMVIYTEVTQS